MLNSLFGIHGFTLDVFLSATRLFLPTPAKKKMTCRSGYPRHLNGCYTVSVNVHLSFHCIRPVLFHISLNLADISLFPQARLLYFTPFFSAFCVRSLLEVQDGCAGAVVTLGDVAFVTNQDTSRSKAVMGFVVYYEKQF